jgi:hypothetical protein
MVKQALVLLCPIGEKIMASSLKKFSTNTGK